MISENPQTNLANYKGNMPRQNKLEERENPYTSRYIQKIPKQNGLV